MAKRIAIQLVGHLRTYKKTYKKLLKNVVEVNKKDGFEVDIFIHTWSETDHSDVTSHNNPTGAKRGVPVGDKIKNLICQYYNPKVLLIEDQQDVDEFIWYAKYRNLKNSYHRMYNIVYSINKSSEIRREYAEKNGISYDWVIVTRPDILVKKPFSINRFLSFYDKEKIEIPANALFYTEAVYAACPLVSDKRLITMCDQLYFARETTMDTATSQYLFVKNREAFKEYVQKDYYIYEGNMSYGFWIKKGIEPIKLRFDWGENFCYLRTIETYGTGKYIIYSISRFIMDTLKFILPYGFVRWYKERLPS